MRRKLPWFEIALSVVVLSAFLYAAFSNAYNLPNRWFIRDDAYYYFKVAQNISEGHGSTFDGIHPTNGYHPLWLLVCIPIFALARYDLILPLRVLVIVTGLLQVGTALLLYRLLRRLVATPIAMLAALYWVFDSYLLVFLYKTAVESSLALFLIVLLLSLVAKFELMWRRARPGAREIALLGIVAALVVFARLDLIFFALVMGVWVVLRGSPLRYLLPLDLLAIFVSVLAAFILRLTIPHYYDSENAALTMAVLAMLIRIPTFYFFGLYSPPASWRPLAFVVRMVLAALAGAAVLAAVLLAGAALHVLPSVPRITLLYELGITFGLVLLTRLAAYAFRSGREPQAASSPLDELRLAWRGWLRDGAVYYGIVGGSLALYMLWNRLAFGSFSPVSGLVKRWWGTFWVSVYGGPAKSWLSYLMVNSYNEFDAWHPATRALRDWSNALLYRGVIHYGNPPWQARYAWVLVLVFIAVVGILLMRRGASRRGIVQAALVPLFAGSWLQALSYNATGYASPKEWYWLTEPVLIVILAALLLNVAVQLFLRRWAVTRVLLWVLVAAYAYRQGTGYWTDTVALNSYSAQERRVATPEITLFVEKHSPPGAVVGMTGGGNVGYFIHDRTIVNMDGLINSTAYFEALKAGTGSDFLYESGLRYVFANPGLLSANPYRTQYDGRLIPVASWGGKELMKLLPAPPE